MPRVEREMVINRPVEEVFDFMADGRNEPHYNPHMLRAEQTSGRVDLNVNLLVWGADEGVVEHVNGEVDVLLVGIAGDGLAEVDGMAHPLRAGQALIIPKGVRRAIRSTGGRFAYLTCHRRPAGLWPHRLPHAAGDQRE